MENGVWGINLSDFKLYYKLRQYGTGRKTDGSRPMDQGRKPKDKHIHPRAPYLWQKRQEYAMEKREPVQ